MHVRLTIVNNIIVVIFSIRTLFFLFFTFKDNSSLRKHPFLLAFRRLGRYVPPRETSPAVKSEEKRMFSQAKTTLDQNCKISLKNAASALSSIFVAATF